MGRQPLGMDRPGVRQVPEGSGEQGKMAGTACEIICGAPTTLAVKGLMMMMMMKETQTAVVWSCFPFIRSGQNHLARHSERGKKTRQTEEEMGRQHQGMDRPGVRHIPDSSGEQGKMEETGCEIICGALTTRAVEG